MHGQFYPHFGCGLHIHMRPTVNFGLESNLYLCLLLPSELAFASAGPVFTITNPRFHS